jgi:hypothetical protein
LKITNFFSKWNFIVQVLLWVMHEIIF